MLTPRVKASEVLLVRCSSRPHLLWLLSTPPQSSSHMWLCEISLLCPGTNSNYQQAEESGRDLTFDAIIPAGRT